MERRAKTKFCFKTIRTATETFQLKKQAYGDNTFSRTRGFECYERFRDGLVNLEDERSRRPTAVPTPDMIETVGELILTDRQIILRMMEEELEISKETIRKILMDDLGKRKICGRFFHTVSPMNRRVSDCNLVKNLINLWVMIVPYLTQI
jgi:hypothetical protein